MLFGIVVPAASMSYATYPLALELAADVLYPSNENAVGGWIAGAISFLNIIFFSVFLIPNIGQSHLLTSIFQLIYVLHHNKAFFLDILKVFHG